MTSYFTVLANDPTALTRAINDKIIEHKKTNRDEPVVIASYCYYTPSSNQPNFAALMSMLVPNPVYAEDEEEEEDETPMCQGGCGDTEEDCGWCDTCETSACECERCRDCDCHDCECERCECCNEKLDNCECDKCDTCEKHLCEKASDLDDPVFCTCFSNLETTAISAE